jgi:hypothetical protein
VSSIAVRFATETDAPGIRALFRRIFEKEMTAEEWDWKYPRNPDGWLGTVAVMDGEIVGNYSGCGMRFQIGATECLAYAIGDVATHPKARQLGRRGVFSEMTELFFAEVGRRGLPFCFGFPNDRHLAISHRFVAGAQSLRPIIEKRVPCESLPAPAPGFAFGDAVGDSFEALWRTARESLPAAALRDRLRANWRFRARPTRSYRMLWRESGGEVASWAVLSVVGENAFVADYLCRTPDGRDLPELFTAAAAEAARLGARRLVFWETPGGPGAPAIAALPGTSVPAGFTLIARVFDAEAARLFASGHLTPALYDVI